MKQIVRKIKRLPDFNILYINKYDTNVWQSHQALLPYICLLFSDSFLQIPAIHRAFWPTDLKLFCTTNFVLSRVLYDDELNL